MTDKPSSQIDSEARKILRQWSRCAYYVYLRPLDFRFINPSAEFAVHWKVTVEYRGVGYQQHVAEGMNLSEVIKKLGEEVPLRKPKLPPRHSVPPPTERKQVVIKRSKKKKAIGGHSSSNRDVSELRPPPGKKKAKKNARV